MIITISGSETFEIYTISQNNFPHWGKIPEALQHWGRHLALTIPFAVEMALETLGMPTPPRPIAAMDFYPAENPDCATCLERLEIIQNRHKNAIKCSNIAINASSWYRRHCLAQAQFREGFTNECSSWALLKKWKNVGCWKNSNNSFFRITHFSQKPG